MDLIEFKKLHIPEQPGVYTFKKDGQVLYIGKATSLRERLRSYFNPDLEVVRSKRIVNMVKVADQIEFEVTESVLEAFIRETELIKKYQPIANTIAKDNKSFNYVVITKEDFPRVLVVRGRNIEQEVVGFQIAYTFGPYPFGSELREALRIIRKIFPFRDTCVPKSELPNGKSAKPCFNRSIGLCPGVCTGEISKKEYAKTIRNIQLFFKGKKGKIIELLHTQMMTLAKARKFEEAQKIKKTIFALQHIKDISMIKKESEGGKSIGGQKDVSWNGKAAARIVRVESYDIAHMAGKDMVGAMCVMTDDELDTSAYRKFIIKDFDTSNDTGALREIIRRRFAHNEWRMPDVIVVDGGRAQIDAVLDEVKKSIEQIKISTGRLMDHIPMPYVVSVVKDASHKAREILYTSADEILINSIQALISEDKIKELNAETHRFAITFHKQKRAESFLPKKS
jgi:excinuclease ABC subunit C